MRRAAIYCGMMLVVLLVCSALRSSQAQERQFRADLSGAQEVPPNGSEATGEFEATLNEAQTQLTFELDVSNFTNTFTAAHIHRAPADVNGPVVLPLDGGQFPHFTGVWALTAQDVTDLLAGNLYVNVHSTVFPGGEIRGQIGAVASCDLEVGDVVTAPGEIVTVPITINQAPNAVDALGLNLTFDPAILQFVSSTRGALVQNWTQFDVANPQSGSLTIGGFTTEGAIQAGASGTLIELQFQVVCTNCGAATFTELVPINLVDDIATWNACAGDVAVVFCVEGQGLNVGDASGSGDAIVSIPVTIAEQGALNTVDALGFDLAFDPDVLQYTGSFTRGPLVANWTQFGANVVEPGKLRVAGFTTEDAIQAGESGTLVELQFQVVCSDCEQGETEDLFVVALFDDLVGWPACPGIFTFGCPNCGDTDLNNAITPNDALQAFQHFLQLIVLEGCPLEQTDVDGNGSITPADALEIFKKFLQLPSVIDDNPACSF